MKSRLSRPSLASGLLMLCLGLAACSGGGGGGSPASAAPPLNAGVNLTGNYNLTLAVTSATGNCANPVGFTTTRPTTVNHDTTTGVVVIDGGTPEAIRGTLDGARVTLTFVVPDPSFDFTTTITFAADGSTFSGTYRTTDLGVANPCTENGSANASRLVGPPPLNAGVDLTGAYNVALTVATVTGNCPDPVGTISSRVTPVIHDTTTGTVTFDAGTPLAIRGTLNGAQVTLTPVTANPAKTFSATITFSPDGTTFTGTANQAEIGGADPCSQTDTVTATRATPNPLSVTLDWTGSADLDLEIVEPDGTVLGFATPESASGGVHSGDRNTCAVPTDPAEETAAWFAAPLGSYEFRVRDFNDCGGSQTQFTITVRYQNTPIFTDTQTITNAGAFYSTSLSLQ